MERRHPLSGELGKLARDERSDSVGVLMDVWEYAEFSEVGGAGSRKPPMVAFLRPDRGGREWCVPPDSLTVLDERIAGNRASPAMAGNPSATLESVYGDASGNASGGASENAGDDGSGRSGSVRWGAREAAGGDAG